MVRYYDPIIPGSLMGVLYIFVMFRPSLVVTVTKSSGTFPGGDNSNFCPGEIDSTDSVLLSTIIYYYVGERKLTCIGQCDSGSTEEVLFIFKRIYFKIVISRKQVKAVDNYQNS